MQILIDYRRLAEHIHVSEADCFELLLDKKYREKQMAKNPGFFIVVTDEFEKFFYDWRNEAVLSQAALERRLLDWDNEFAKNEKHHQETNRILGKLLPLLITIIEKINMSNVHTEKLNQEVDVLVPLVESLIKGLADAKTANDELKQARADGKANDETIDATTGKIDTVIAEAQTALATAAADGQTVPPIGADTSTPPADGGDTPVDPNAG